MENRSQLLIILPRVRVQNANAISSPLTWGFPSITAILGFSHALERKLRDIYDINFVGVGVVCHKFDPQIFGDYVKNFSLMRKPSKKDGNNAALVEEGRVHLTISLIIKAEGSSCALSADEEESFANEIFCLAQTLRIAGGSILPSLHKSKKFKPVCSSWPSYTDDQLKKSRKILNSLLPGAALLNRENLLNEYTANLKETDNSATTLDALLNLSTIKYCSKKEDDGSVNWSMEKKSGWLVPITVGYQAISELYSPGTVEHARDSVTPFQFVENIYSIGEWKWVHKIDNIEEILWRYKVENDLYLCVN